MLYSFYFIPSKEVTMERNVMENLRQHQQQCAILLEKLDEQKRRHVAGLLALTLGHGGVQFVAELVNMDRDTVSRGKHELLDEFADCPVNRQRKPGAGRPALEKKRKQSNASNKSSPNTPEANQPANGNSSG
jgi:6-phosphogluconolactonase/glucosamine-6-phosphate isomerase/deaminase